MGPAAHHHSTVVATPDYRTGRLGSTFSCYGNKIIVWQFTPTRLTKEAVTRGRTLHRPEHCAAVAG